MLKKLMLVFFALASSQPAYAAEFFCPSGNVTCLIAAINEANATPEEDTIHLEAGTYTLTIVHNNTDGANGLPSITSTIAIKRSGAGITSIERDANAPRFRIVHVVAGGSLTLEGVAVRLGHEMVGGGILNRGRVSLNNGSVTDNSMTAPGTAGGIWNSGTLDVSNSLIDHNGVFSPSPLGAMGGGIVNDGGTVTLTDSIVSRNSPGNGNVGGIWNVQGTMTLTNTRVISNNTRFGAGGISNQSTLIIINSVLNSNASARSGGGISNSGRVTLINSTVERNTAPEGGGIVNGGTFVVNGSSLSGNSGMSGGGILNVGDGTLGLTNSTVANNRAVSRGGGFRIDGGTVTLSNSTVAENHLTDIFETSGGGIWNRDGTVKLQNTILARNRLGPGSRSRGPDCFGPVTSLDHNIIGDPTDCTITLLLNDLTGDPGLADFTDDGSPGVGHFPLLPDSQAIDRGNPEACPEADQLGLFRTGICDIGAVEFGGQMLVAIHVRPRSEANRINPNSEKEIRVAIFTTNGFDATTVDPNTVRFGATGTEAAPVNFRLRDIDGDGQEDMILRFNIQDTGIRCGDTFASLTGQTSSGLPIVGSDSIRTVGCKR